MKTHPLTNLLFVFLIITTLLVHDASAQYPTTPLEGGEQHYYSVLLDGEGDAAVAAKLVIYNTHDTPLERITFEIPGDSVRIINAVQEGRTRVQSCQQYSNECVKFAPSVNCLQYDNYDCTSYERPCLERSNKCINMGWSDGPFGYQKINSAATPLSHSTALELTLPSPIQPQQQSAVLLYYKAGPVATRSLGRFSYDFETIKVGDDIANVRVAINVPQEFVLAGAESRTDYLGASSQFSAVEKTMAEPMIATDAMSSISRQIEYQQGIIKTSAALDPHESFHVTGEYAHSRWALYWEYFIAGSAVLIALVALCIFGCMKLYRHGKGLPAWIAASLTGIGNSILICLLFYGAFVFIDFMSRGAYRWQPALPLLFIAWVALMLVALFVPSIVVGVKKGPLHGVIAFSVMMLSLIIIAVLLATLSVSIWPGGVVY